MKERITAKGRVETAWTDGRTTVRDHSVHNALSYTAADVMAAAYGGDSSRIPKYVGFVYGPASQPALEPVSRDMDWDSVREAIAAVGGNMQVVRFSRKPTISRPGPDESNDGGEYEGNTVEFHAISRSGVDGVYADDTSGQSGFAGQLTAGMYLYRSVLLGDPANCEDGYTVLGMADLAKGGSYRAKPDNYELALDWRVTFS